MLMALSWRFLLIFVAERARCLSWREWSELPPGGPWSYETLSHTDRPVGTGWFSERICPVPYGRGQSLMEIRAFSRTHVDIVFWEVP